MTRPEPPQWQEWRDMQAEVERRYVAATPIVAQQAQQEKKDAEKN